MCLQVCYSTCTAITQCKRKANKMHYINANMLQFSAYVNFTTAQLNRDAQLDMISEVSAAIGKVLAQHNIEWDDVGANCFVVDITGAQVL